MSTSLNVADTEQRIWRGRNEGAGKPTHNRSHGDGPGMNASAERRINNLFKQALKEERKGRPIQARACRQSARLCRYLWEE